MRVRLPLVCAAACAFVLAGCRREGPAPAAPTFHLDAARAAAFAALSLECVDREYPNKPGNVIENDEQVKPPRELTPAFHGCFDWHSAVHGHWALVRLLRTRPDLPNAAAVRAAVGRHLTPERIAGEVAYLAAERNRTFERPYGYGWLLRLAAEVRAFADADARTWDAALEPLAALVAERMRDYLGRLSVPVREGTHSSTAFALVHTLDYARVVGDGALEAAVTTRARDFYGRDVDCPTHFEPSGEDFISPCLVEADLMRRVLPAPEFVRWLDRFLPAPGSARFRPVAEPAEIRDPKDYRIGHLIGLHLQRAASFEGLAGALPAGDARVAPYRAMAARHRDAALAQMTEAGYGGAHWLASFAIYLLTGVGQSGGGQP
jgi:rhodanese-related sulfurtransferase